ncbi:MAG: histidinol-phosphatase, partial [bacterium]
RGRMQPDQLTEYVQLVERTAEQWRGRLEVHLGLECDYMPGYESWLDAQLGEADFKYVLGSIHPHLQGYRDAYWRGDPLAFQRNYFTHLAQAAETGLFDALAHPDLVKNVTPDHWQPTRILDVIGESLDRIARTGLAMELNTSGLLKTVPEMNPGPIILQEMAQRAIPVILGSDAHEPRRAGEAFANALDMLETAGYRHIHYRLEGQSHELPIVNARAALEHDT